MKFSPPRLLTLATAVAALALLAASGGLTFDFMPKGGRALLVERIGESSAQLREIVQQKRSEAQWLDYAKDLSKKKLMTDKEQATLAAYLAVNMPAATSVQGAAALPPDGRDLAWEQCQNCHSLFTGYLTQSGSATRWRNEFQFPFHRNLKMTPQEREEFARYSEINMPMKAEDVPQDLRF
jgi:hypothetical protein